MSGNTDRSRESGEPDPARAACVPQQIRESQRKECADFCLSLGVKSLPAPRHWRVWICIFATKIHLISELDENSGFAGVGIHRSGNLLPTPKR